MSTFYFRCLILGFDPNLINFYISSALNEEGEDQEGYYKWYKEIKVLDNICELEIDVIKNITVDLDEIIPMVDGIIYFLNPTITGESELFEMILPDIFSVKRDIPTIIIFYDNKGILPVSVNELLTHIWVNFPSLEAFVNLSPKYFHQALQSICSAMINGDTPLNIENAWMRFPIFIQMANIYYNNQNYYYAAQAIRKAALIADIYNKEEFFIICEQAAFLYSKINLYLEASQILEKVDRKKSLNFKKLYAEAIIREGNQFFNRNEYKRAARNYERAAQWSSIESLDKLFINEAFRLAINSWVSACKIEDAFRILQSMPHKDVLVILKEIAKKIAAAAEYLFSINNIELAREQLYIAINRYQREDLFKELKILTEKLAEMLISILEKQVSERKNHAAKNTYDELENLWVSYKVEKVNLDSTLEELINNFLKSNNFNLATSLIEKLISRELKQQIAKTRDKLEDKYNALKKKEVEDYINKGIEILRVFFNTEIDIVAKENRQEIKIAEELVKQKKYFKSAILLKNRAEYLKKIGKEDISDQILTKSLDNLLEGLKFEDFFSFFIELSRDMKKRYLTRILPKFIQKLQELRKSGDFIIKEKIFDDSIRLYRNQMLYDQSKEVSTLFIKVIKSEVLSILEKEGSLSSINKAEMYIKKVIDISSSYLEKEESIDITFNKIYKRIAEIYIELDNLHLAQIYNDKIVKKEYKTEIHKKIEELEAEKSAIRSEKAKETRRGEELKEKGSIIETRAREALLDKESDKKERNGLRRRYFREGLNYLKHQEYDKAFEIYKNTINRFNLRNKYRLAGVSLAVAALILMKQDKVNDAKKLLEQIIKPLSGLGKLFSESFAVTLLEYIIGLKEVQDNVKFKDSIYFFEVLPLFEEELELLNDYLGVDIFKEEKEEITKDKIIDEEEKIKDKISRKEFGEKSKLQIEIDQRFGKIQSKKGEAQKEKEIIYNKRKPMRKRYYSSILELIKAQELKNVAREYLKLGNSFSKRKDFESSSLMILLHGLSLLKVGEPLESIRKNINDFLNNLGVNKKMFEETLYIRLVIFLIDIRQYSLNKYLPEIKEMLKMLPLFEEEEILIEIED
ncbi:MAG: hypothetical protein ACFFC3_13310 [Candidatus Odinarchaeota archaeon]